jgi:hypothetical protein
MIAVLARGHREEGRNAVVRKGGGCIPLPIDSIKRLFRCLNLFVTFLVGVISSFYAYENCGFNLLQVWQYPAIPTGKLERVNSDV